MGDTTFFKEEGVHVCNDCGAYARNIEDILHYRTCVPGESKKWKKFYEDLNNVDVEGDVWKKLYEELRDKDVFTELIESILKWWDYHYADTTGDHGEHNLYDETPEFVVLAKKLKGGD